MQLSVLPEERFVLDLVRQAARELGLPAFVVGGYVRDRLLNRAGKDLDFVCLGSGIDLAKAVAARCPRPPKVSVYANYGTAMLQIGDWQLEFVGARRESYRQDSRNPLVEDGSLEDDQNRRDFTINALAWSLRDEDFGQIIDPFDGLGDLERGLIRTPLEPARTFSDDPLRMMRAIRFACQLGFKIEAQTLAGIKTQAKRIEIIAQERITGELEKILDAQQPSIGFKLLFDTGLLALIFPELQAMQGIEVQEGQGHKDNFYHTLEVVDNLAALSDNRYLRWAALLHDIAKPLTKRYYSGQGWTFHGHEALGAKVVGKVFKRFKLPLDGKLKYVQKLVAMHQRPILLTKEPPSDSALRRLLFEAGDELEDLLTLCQADSSSKNPQKRERYLQNLEALRLALQVLEEKDHLRNWQPPISGEEIMALFDLKPGPMVGQLKNAIREAILEGEIPNEVQAAMQFVLKTAAGMGLEPKENQT